MSLFSKVVSSCATICEFVLKICVQGFMSSLSKFMSSFFSYSNMCFQKSFQNVYFQKSFQTCMFSKVILKREFKSYFTCIFKVILKRVFQVLSKSLFQAFNFSLPFELLHFRSLLFLKINFNYPKYVNGLGLTQGMKVITLGLSPKYTNNPLFGS